PGARRLTTRPRSDDDQRLAETEVAPQPAADLLVRQPGTGAIDDGAEDVAVGALCAARQRIERLRDCARRAGGLRRDERLDMAAHRVRVRPLDRGPAAGLVFGLVLVDADDH